MSTIIGRKEEIAELERLYHKMRQCPYNPDLLPIMIRNVLETGFYADLKPTSTIFAYNFNFMQQLPCNVG